jgi:pimeloyl-ACP methyl ester carboxylesterase
MTEPVLHHMDCPDAAGSHRMAWWEWNETGNPQHPHVVICVHGLSRQGRDFDTLARALCGQVRVVCPDVAGRGQSDWLKDPMAYQLPVYAADMFGLLQQLRAPVIDWVGTSLGGLIGMAVAGYVAPGTSAGPSIIRRLVLNDVGPAIEFASIERMAGYVGADPLFASEQQAVDYLWSLSTTFGPHTPEQWLALSRPMLKAVPGGWRLHYDPAIGVPVKAATREAAAQGEAMLWQLYDQIRARTLVIRGAQSDLLSRETAQAMTQRGPKAQLIEFAGIGHAPTLVAPDQVEAVRRFLLD